MLSVYITLPLTSKCIRLAWIPILSSSDCYNWRPISHTKRKDLMRLCQGSHITICKPDFWSLYFLIYETWWLIKGFGTPYILDRAAAADKFRIGRAKSINLSSYRSNILYTVQNTQFRSHVKYRLECLGIFPHLMWKFWIKQNKSKSRKCIFGYTSFQH